MNSELKEMGKQLKEILDKYPNRQKEILFYIFGEDTIRKIVNKPTYEELQQQVNQLESILNKIIDWKDKNGNRYIYQDSLGEDWYFYDLDVFDELGEILNEVGGFNG